MPPWLLPALGFARRWGGAVARFRGPTLWSPSLPLVRGPGGPQRLMLASWPLVALSQAALSRLFRGQVVTIGG